MRDPNQFSRIALPSFLGAMLVLLILSAFADSEIIIAIAAVLAVAFFALFFIFWRCPSCGKLLPNGSNFKCCPYCGHKFGENDDK